MRGGQSVQTVAAILGGNEQSLRNWLNAEKQGLMKGTAVRPVIAEQMEISRLRAVLARVNMERDILNEATAYVAKECEVRLN